MHPFDVPEVLAHIGSFLDTKDCLNCIHVSKAFHAAFVPHIWRTVVAESEDVGGMQYVFPSGQTLERHKLYIQSVAFLNVFPLEYMLLQGCNRLKSITCSAWDVASTSSDVEAKAALDLALSGLSSLIGAHSSTLRNFGIDMLHQITMEPPPEFWRSLLECRSLERLSLFRLGIPDHCLNDFIQLCSKPRFLTLTEVTIPEWPSTLDQQGQIVGEDYVLFANLRELSFIGSSQRPSRPTLSPQGQAILFRRCPNLESLTWKGGQSAVHFWDENDLHPGQDEDVTAFFSTLCAGDWMLPQLESLNLSGVSAEDGDLAQLLMRMRRLKSLKVSRTRFGRLSFQELIRARAASSAGDYYEQDQHDGPGRLCDSVLTLRIDQCRSLTSEMVQIILASCRSLKTLHAGRVNTADIAQGQEWACTGMTELDIELDAECRGRGLSLEQLLEKQRTVYGRLATLNRLQVLRLTGLQSRGSEKATLDLRLQSGLGVLHGLKDLHELSFGLDIYQQMGVPEAQWIVENWPSMRSLSGVANGDETIIGEMRAVLDAKQIDLFSYIY